MPNLNDILLNRELTNSEKKKMVITRIREDQPLMSDSAILTYVYDVLGFPNV